LGLAGGLAGTWSNNQSRELKGQCSCIDAARGVEFHGDRTQVIEHADIAAGAQARHHDGLQVVHHLGVRPPP
jgi:hypothetical protein